MGIDSPGNKNPSTRAISRALNVLLESRNLDLIKQEIRKMLPEIEAYELRWNNALEDALRQNQFSKTEIERIRQRFSEISMIKRPEEIEALSQKIISIIDWSISEIGRGIGTNWTPDEQRAARQMANQIKMELLNI